MSQTLLQKYKYKNLLQPQKVRPPLEFRVFWPECSGFEQEIRSVLLPSSWPQPCWSKSNFPDKITWNVFHINGKKLLLKSFENTVTKLVTKTAEAQLTGATALTRMPYGAHSIAKDFVRLSTAARAAPVWLVKKRKNVNFSDNNKQEKWSNLLKRQTAEPDSYHHCWI